MPITFTQHINTSLSLVINEKKKVPLHLFCLNFSFIMNLLLFFSIKLKGKGEFIADNRYYWLLNVQNSRTLKEQNKNQTQSRKIKNKIGSFFLSSKLIDLDSKRWIEGIIKLKMIIVEDKRKTSLKKTIKKRFQSLIQLTQHLNAILILTVGYYH